MSQWQQIITALFTLISIGSCSHALSGPIDTLWFNKLENKAIGYYRQKSMEKYFSTSLRYLKAAEARSFESGIGKGNYFVGSYYYAVSQYDSAYYYFYHAQKKYKQVNDSVGVAENLLNMAIISKNVADYYTSESLSVEALRYLNGLSDTALVTALYNNLGVIFSELEDYERSVSWYTKSLRLASEPVELLTLRNNIGVVYRKRKQFDQALDYFESALSVDGQDGVPEYRAMVIDNIGYAKFLRDGSGIEELLQAKEMRERISNQRGIITSYLHLGEYYLKQDQRDKAIDYLKRSLEQSRKIGSTKSELSALLLLAESNAESEYLDQYLRIQDSVARSERILRNTFASIRFETMESEVRNLELETKNSKMALKLESERKNNAYLWGIIGGLFLLFLIVFLYVRYRRRRLEFKARIEQLRARLEEQDRISMQLHHDIANDLLSSIGQFDARNKELQDDELEQSINFLESVYLSTVQVSHELGSQRFKGLPFKRGMQILFAQIEKTGDLELHHEGLESVNWETVPIELRYEVYLIIKELVSNVQKHAKATFAKVGFEERKNNLILWVEDNGIGMNVLGSSGIGLVTIERKIKDELKGKFVIHSSPSGTRVNINIPIQ